MPILLPNSDVAQSGSWTTNPGDLTYYTKIDEGVAGHDGDATSVLSAIDPATDTITFGLPAGTDPGIHTGHVIRVAARKNTSGGKTMRIVVELQQASDPGNPIASLVQDDLPETYGIYSLDLSELQASGINDYGTLQLRVVATVSGTGSGRRLIFSAVEFEIPSAAEGQPTVLRTWGVPTGPGARIRPGYN